ncbi:MAG: hypothetical protein ACF8R9_05520 [Phycisphaerales bacterium JB054]
MAKKKAARRPSTPTHASANEVRSSGDPVAGKSASEILAMVAAQRPPASPRPKLLEIAAVEEAITAGKQRRRRVQPPEIEHLAMALVRLAGAAEVLAHDVSLRPMSNAPVFGTNPPTLEEFLAFRRRLGEAKGGVWSEAIQQEQKEEYAHHLREAEELSEDRQAVLELNDRLDELESAYPTARPTIEKTYRAHWAADQKLIIDRVFKNVLHQGLARQPWLFRADLAQPGIDAAIALAHWLYDAVFPEPKSGSGKPSGRNRGKQTGRKSTGNRYQWLARAMLCVREHPDWSDAAIATEVGVNKSTLSRSPEFGTAAALARGEERPRGKVITKRGTKQRTVEAFDDSFNPNRSVSRQSQEEEDVDERIDREMNEELKKRNTQRNG